MRNNRRFLDRIAFWALAGASLLAANAAFAGTVTLNFDSVALLPCTATSATTYLNGFGVTFSAITPAQDTVPTIVNTSCGSGAFASSAPNDFEVSGTRGVAAVSYQLDFSAPLTSVGFTRDAIISNAGIAPWVAEALDAQGHVLASVSEGFLIGPLAHTYTLSGSAIASLRIDARNDLTATSFNSPPLDNITLTSAPEPGSGILMGAIVVPMLLLTLFSKRTRLTPRRQACAAFPPM